jgi:hypothetical protein
MLRFKGQHLGGQVRGEHEEVERFAGVAHSLVDGADGEVRLLGVGRQPDDLRAQLQGLLVPAILKVSSCEMPKMMCNTIVAQRNSIAHLIVPLVQQLAALLWADALQHKGLVCSCSRCSLATGCRLEQGIDRTSRQAAVLCDARLRNTQARTCC